MSYTPTEHEALRRQYQWKRVRIKRGATILGGTHPRNNEYPRKLGRTVEVECRSVFPAYTTEPWLGHEQRSQPAQLTYAGSGGYWVDVELDPEFVEVIDA